jgi:hypothetical protein
MPRINKVQKYATLWLHHQGWDVDNISTELELTTRQVKNIVKDLEPVKEEKNNEQSKPKVKSSKDFMITESVNGNHRVSIMTKTASEINDESKKSYRAQINNKNLSYIYKPNGN